MSRWLFTLAALAWDAPLPALLGADAPPVVLPAHPAAPAAIDFNRDVRPILSDKCFACHGPDVKHRKADIRFDDAKDALASGAIVPGKPAESSFIARITTDDERDRMPPKKSGKKLSAAEIETLQKW